MSQSSEAEAYPLRLHEVIESETDKYEVLQFIGSGTFGQVAKCLKQSSNELVALKILNKLPCNEEQGYNEMKILDIINQEDTEQFRFVRAVEFFSYRKHLCLAFEMLEQSLSDFLHCTTSLSAKQELRVIHSDLKPDNVMVENPTAPPYRVKVIDFGSAFKTDEADRGDLIQTLPYRAPEILLGLPYAEEVDMWSLGCIAAELFLKWPLYPGSNEFDQIRLITQMQGLPPAHMLNDGSKAFSFFNISKEDDWNIKSLAEYEEETGEFCDNYCKYSLNCWEDIYEINLPDLQGEDLHLELMGRKSVIDLVQKMLELDPKKRITPEDALELVATE